MFHHHLFNENTLSMILIVGKFSESIIFIHSMYYGFYINRRKRNCGTNKCLFFLKIVTGLILLLLIGACIAVPIYMIQTSGKNDQQMSSTIASKNYQINRELRGILLHDYAGQPISGRLPSHPSRKIFRFFLAKHEFVLPRMSLGK